MAKQQKHITSLDSLMIFTGKNANKNALALEDRNYGFNDEFIGELELNRTYDSDFNKFPNEIFVETTPKYKSVKDLTSIAYSYICNKSKTKPTEDSSIYLDGENVFNIKYDFDKHLNANVENSKQVPFDDLKLYLCSINNGLYNKQKYYRNVKELQALIDKGIKFTWQPAGSVISDTYSNVNYEFPNGDFVSYNTYTKQVQEKKWNPATSTYEDVIIEELDEEGNVIKKASYITTVGVEYLDKYDDTLVKQLSDITDDFTNKVTPEMYEYYIYALNSEIPFITLTYSFSQQDIYANVNYDGEYNNWFHNRIKFNVHKDNLEVGSTLAKVEPSEKYTFNIAYNVDKVEYVSERLYNNVESASEIEFKVENTISEDELSVLSPHKIKKLDLSSVAGELYGEIDLLSQYDKYINSKDTVSTNWNNERGNVLEELIIGKEGVECQITNIIGLNEFKNLKNIDLRGCNNLQNNPDLSELPNVSDADFARTNITVFKPSRGSVLNEISLPDCTESIVLNDITFTKDLNYHINDNLTTLELNNVQGIDTYEFVHNWLQKLKEANKLDSGLVNYVNINGVDWEYVDFQDLLDLKVIELNKFTGNIDVHGIGYGPEIYRRDYLKLIDAYGVDVLHGNKDLKINVTLQKDAFDIKVFVVEQYEVSDWVLNQYGEYEEVITIEERILNEDEPYIIKIENNPFNITGNSLLNMIEDESAEFEKFSVEDFINNNRMNIGWSKKLSHDLILPDATENIAQLEAGDVLLFGTDTLVIVTKNIQNINQQFTRLGKIENYEDFEIFINYINSKWLLTFEYKETEIEKSPISNRNHYIEVNYKDTADLFDIEPNISEDNAVEVEYDGYWFNNMFDKQFEDNIIEVEYDGEQVNMFKSKPNIDKNNLVETKYNGYWFNDLFDKAVEVDDEHFIETENK